MYSAHNEGKSVIAERFIRILKNKVNKYMTPISKNMYIDKLNDIVDKYDNTSHSTIKIKPANEKSSTYIDFDKNNKKEDPKFKAGDYVKISEYKNILAKGYVPIFNLITKVKNTVPRTYVISDLNGEAIIGTLYKKELQKTNEKEFRIEKLIKREGDKLYVNWKGYDNSFYSWIDKKDLVT